jgi:vacuolar-type H+-ATPase subunit H
VRRLNDAELEAKKEIDRLRAEMEEKFQREVGQSDGSGDEKLRAFVAVTKKEQEKMLADFEKNKGTVQELLLHFVTTVDLSVSESTKQSLLKAYA